MQESPAALAGPPRPPSQRGRGQPACPAAKTMGPETWGGWGRGPAGAPQNHLPQSAPWRPGLLQGLPALGLRAAHFSGHCDDPSHTSEPTPPPCPAPHSLLPAILSACTPCGRGSGPTAKVILPQFQKGCLPGRAPSCLGAPESKPQGKGLCGSWRDSIPGALSGWDAWACEAPPPSLMSSAGQAAPFLLSAWVDLTGVVSLWWC